MAESYISELGDSLSHGVANTNGVRVKIIAPEKYKVSGSETYKTLSEEIEKVKQTADNASTGTGYELLFSETGDNTTRTEGTRKSSKLTFQPSTGTLTATTFSGTATKVSTAVDTSSSLYLLGVTSSDTTTVKRDTGITVKNDTITALLTYANDSSAVKNIISVTGGNSEFDLAHSAPASDAIQVQLMTKNTSTSTISLGNQVNGTYKEAIAIRNGEANTNSTIRSTASGKYALNVSLTTQTWGGINISNTYSSIDRSVSLEMDSTGKRGLYTDALGTSGSGWWCYLDENNNAYFKGKADTATHASNAELLQIKSNTKKLYFVGINVLAGDSLVDRHVECTPNVYLRLHENNTSNAPATLFYMERNDGNSDVGLEVKRTDKTYNNNQMYVLYGIGTSGDAYGIYSYPLSNWAFKGVASENKVYIHAGGTGTSAKYLSFVAGSIGTEANTIYFP